MDPLQRELANYNYLKDCLRLDYPDIDDETLSDTLEGGTNLFGLIAWVLDKAYNDEALVAGIDQRIRDLQTRKSRLNDRVGKSKAAIVNAMEKSGVKKHEFAEETISVKKTPDKVLVVDETLIPDVYFNVKQVKTLDKKALNEALTSGSIEGAMLSNGGTTLAIRKK